VAKADGWNRAAYSLSRRERVASISEPGEGLWSEPSCNSTAKVASQKNRVLMLSLSKYEPRNTSILRQAQDEVLQLRPAYAAPLARRSGLSTPTPLPMGEGLYMRSNSQAQYQ